MHGTDIHEGGAPRFWRIGHAESQRSPVILDCDGVLLDWVRSFAHWLYMTRKLPVDPNGPCSYDMQAWTGLDSVAVKDAINEFNHSPVFEDISPAVGARWAVGQMARAGLELHVITSCTDDKTAVERRRRNLRRCFGDVFTEIDCLPLGGNKIELLAAKKPGVWVEDRYIHALDGLYCGHKTYMVRRNHNRHLEGTSKSNIRWIDGLHEVVSDAIKITERE